MYGRARLDEAAQRRRLRRKQLEEELRLLEAEER